MTKDDALKLALEALETALDFDIDAEDGYYLQAITAIKEALAQPEQEPVIGTKTWFEDGKVVTQYLYPSDIYTTPPQPEQEPVVQYIGVYTTPSQRKPLTDEQIDEEFKLYASKFDTSSDKWLDMGADDYFKAGFKAAHGIKE